MIDFDFTDSTLTKQAATNKMREIVLSELVECFRTKYGDEAVSIVGNNEISIGRFIIKDSDGFLQEVNINLSPVVKPWEDNSRFHKYDRLTEEECYLSYKKLKE